MSTSFANFGFLEEVPLSLPAIFEQTIVALRWDIYSKNLFMNYCKLSLSAFIVNLSSLWKQLPFRYLLYQHRYRCVCEGTVLVSSWDIYLYESLWGCENKSLWGTFPIAAGIIAISERPSVNIHWLCPRPGAPLLLTYVSFLLSMHCTLTLRQQC